METLREAMERLQGQGFTADLRAAPGARLRCGECDTETPAGEVTIEETVRFEGPSNPGDESVLFAVRGACEHPGLYSAAYGPDTPPDDMDVIRALPDES